MIPTGLGIFSGIIFCLAYSYFTGKFPKKIKCCDDGWQPIETFPHHEVRSTEITQLNEYILTDGTNVKSTFFPYYNENGEIILGYYENKATHWRYLPLPPFSEIKEQKHVG